MNSIQVNLGRLVLLATVMLVLVFGLINFYWVRREATATLTKELEIRAVHHARSLALQAMDPILLDDRLQLKYIVEETKSLDSEVAYVFLVGPGGEVVAHTFPEGFPVELLAANQLPAERDYMIRRIVDKRGREEPLRDIVAPIGGGFAGFAHVGLKEDLILTGVRGVSRAVGGMVSIFILLGLAASFLFTKMVTRPLQNLASAAARVNLEMLQTSMPSPPELFPRHASLYGLETEVDQLAGELGLMVERLSTASRQLRETQEQLVLAARLSAIGTLAAGMAHELNNPLAGLKNCLRRIGRDPENREQLQRYLHTMQDSLSRMQKVLQGLLDLARPRQPEVRTISLEPVLDRVILLASHRLTQAHIVPQKEIQPEASVGWADEGQLEQAILNLLLNACDALELRNHDEEFSPQLKLRTLKKEGQLYIEVEDNGMGIEEENVPHLFDPFFTTKEPGKGTGLGLSIARNLVRAHGGDISVESQLGVGSMFRIKLPAHEDHQT